MLRLYDSRLSGNSWKVRILLKQLGFSFALAKLDNWLAHHDWLVDSRYTVADLGVYPYMSMAHEGGYDMDRFAGIRAWLARIEAQPGWIPLLEDAGS